MSEPVPRSSPMIPVEAESPILFFDGVCGFCDRTVNVLQRIDTNRKLKFSPLQGETAARLLPAGMTTKLQSVWLRETDGRLTSRSTAAVRALWHIGGCWKFVAALLWVIPWPLRDLGYRLIAAVRYRLFGKRDTCRLPTPADLEQMLP
ncbi:MAG: DCC1-like thiol-disulfide oxidoreductase family protein [Planctomycetaceae bacterium]